MVTNLTTLPGATSTSLLGPPFVFPVEATPKAAVPPNPPGLLVVPKVEATQ
jgi:hypothetical protein